MKISFNWLKNYINTDLSAEEAGKLLTDCGLEVESIEKFQSVEGGLEGLVIGEVKTREKHPDADRLSVTTVDIGADALLNIVCGASNVEAGQKVVVAIIGATLYPSEGESFQIKKSKIRGQLSEGMICAEDEIGLGKSHEGIMVLDSTAKVGMPAADYFNIETDYVIEIGLTPNRADAASHYGVARDLAAILKTNPAYSGKEVKLKLPAVDAFVEGSANKIIVEVRDFEACPRYSGITIEGVEIKPSPAWLVNRLKAIGLKPINSVVDATNYVLHELGQPLHAFDADKISGNKVIIRKVEKDTPFITLDHVERKLSENDLMICDAEKPMCIAGVFGGLNSGVSNDTKNIFLESAYFNPVSVRKTSKHHGLKTDSSFRFERGTDPEITVYALKRTALLIQEIAGGKAVSPIVDIYPKSVEHFKVNLEYIRCHKLIGKVIEHETIKKIITSLGIKIVSETESGLVLSVPPFKVDVQRDVDVVEEILRIYGYNNIEIPTSVNSSLSYHPKPDKEKLQDMISNLLSDKGFNEIMNNSLTKSGYSDLCKHIDKEKEVRILNPLSSDLNVMRQTILFGGLESIAYNQNRKNADLKFFEFGKSYHLVNKEGDKVTKKYSEKHHLGIWLSGKAHMERWNSADKNVDFYLLKGYLEAILNRLGISNTSYSEVANDMFAFGLSLKVKDKMLAEIGLVNGNILKGFDINQEVFFVDIDWELAFSLATKTKVIYREVPKFPSVRRDLALLLDKQIKFEQIEQLAFQTEKSLLKNVNLFDIYEGDKLPSGKKSYAVSFTLLDEEKTLNDKQIDKIMERLQKIFEEKLGAELRK